MASDRRYYYFEEDDGDGEEEVEWLAMEADEDDVGLLEEDDLHLRLPDDRPADCWVSMRYYYTPHHHFITTPHHTTGGG